MKIIYDSRLGQVIEFKHGLDVVRATCLMLCRLDSSKFKKEDLTKLLDSYREKNMQPLLILVFHLGELPEDFQAELGLIENEGLTKVFTFQFSQLGAQQLVAFKLAEEQNLELREGALKRVFLSILKELQVEEKLKNWIENGFNEGYVIRDLVVPHGISYKDLANTFTWLLNVSSDEFTAQEVFDRTNNLRSYTLYGAKRPGFAPKDIESVSELNRYISYLRDNGFISVKGDIIRIEMTPVEQRIIKILNKFNSLPKNKLINFFVLIGRNADAAFDTYVNILKTKGLIYEENGSIKLISLHNEKKFLSSLLSSFKQKIHGYPKEYLDFAILCSSKERSYRIISLTDLLREIEKMYEDATKFLYYHNPQTFLRQSRLIKDLISYTKKELLPIIEKAVLKARELRSRVDTNFEKLERRINALKRDVSKYIEFKGEIEEQIKLHDLYSSFHNVYSNLNYNGMKEFIKNLWEKITPKKDFPFYFRKAEDDYFFNIRLYMLKEKNHEFNRHNSTLTSLLDELRGIVNTIRKLESQIQNSFMKQEIKGDISIRVYEKLINELTMPPKMIITEKLKLFLIKGLLVKIESSLNRLLEITEFLNTNLNKLSNRELELSSYLFRIEKILNNMKAFLGEELQNYTDRLVSIKSTFETSKEQLYDDIDNLKLYEIGKLNSFFENTHKVLSNIEEKLNPLWRDLSTLFLSKRNEIDEALRRLNLFSDVLKRLMEKHVVPIDEAKKLKKDVFEILTIIKKCPQVIDELMNVTYTSQVADLYKEVLDKFRRVRESIELLFIKSEILDELDLKVLEKIYQTLDVEKYEIKVDFLINEFRKLSSDYDVEKIWSALIKLSSLGLINLYVRK